MTAATFRTACIAAALVGGLSLPAAGARLDATKLYLECGSSVPACTRYLVGVWDGVVFFANLRQELSFCFGTTSAAPNTEQMRLIFLNFARAHPEFLNRNASDVVAASLFAAFPCAADKP